MVVRLSFLNRSFFWQDSLDIYIWDTKLVISVPAYVLAPNRATNDYKVTLFPGFCSYQ